MGLELGAGTLFLHTFAYKISSCNTLSIPSFNIRSQHVFLNFRSDALVNFEIYLQPSAALSLTQGKEGKKEIQIFQYLRMKITF